MLKCWLVKNDCYNRGKMIDPTAIIIHSSGANNRTLKRYVQAAAGQTEGLSLSVEETNRLLGRNEYGNSWNRPGVDACVHAFIGLNAAGELDVVQTLPWNFRAWGVGSGARGTYNDCAIQFEICEDDTTHRDYALKCFNQAAVLCADLIEQFPDLKVSNIVSHREAHDRGYASNHGDPDAWWNKHGLTMNAFRAKVQELLDERKKADEPKGTGNNPSEWAKPATEWCIGNGIFSGDGKGNYDWQRDITREELASILYRLRDTPSGR